MSRTRISVFVRSSKVSLDRRSMSFRTSRSRRGFLFSREDVGTESVEEIFSVNPNDGPYLWRTSTSILKYPPERQGVSDSVQTRISVTGHFLVTNSLIYPFETHTSQKTLGPGLTKRKGGGRSQVEGVGKKDP